MRFSIPHVLTTVAAAGMAALGGAGVVLAEIDDAPGGVLIGILLIVGAVALGLSSGRRRRSDPD